MSVSDDDLAGLNEHERAAIAELDNLGDGDITEIDRFGDEDIPSAAAQQADDGDDDPDAPEAPQAAATDPEAASQPDASVPDASLTQDAPQASPRPVYVADASVADIQAKMDAARASKAEALAKLMDGTLEVEDYTKIEAEADKVIREGERAIIKAEVSREMLEQQQANEWDQAANAFIEVAKTQGIDYRANNILANALDAEIKRLANLPENNDKPAGFFLREAHKAVSSAFNLTAKAPAAAPAKGKGRAVDLSAIPPSLSTLPVAADSPIEADRFAHIRRLEGPALERAYAKLSEADQEEFLP